MAIINLSPFRYPGAKNKLLPIIENYIDEIITDSFADCFVGGGSVLLHVAKKYPNINLYANDKNYNVYSFWKIVSDKDVSGVENLCTLLEQQPTLDLFYSLKEEKTSTDIARAAYIGLFLNRTSFSGIGVNPIGGKNQKSKYKVDCRYNFKKLKQKIYQIHNLLNGRVEVSNLDIKNYHILNTNTPSYLDPPYFNKGKELYSTYMNEQEHNDLSIILNKKSNWILSYDDCSEIRGLYQNKKIIDINAKYSINGKKNKWSEKNELLILG